MHRLTRLPVWAQDLWTALAAGLVWFGVITVMENGDYWYPRHPESYRVAGLWIVLTLALRRVVPGPLFWATAMLYPLALPWPMQTPFELLPLLVAGFAATRSGAVPWALAGLAGGLSAYATQLWDRPHLTFPPVPFSPRWIGLAQSPSDVLLALALVLGAVAAGYFFRRLALTSERLRERNAELQALQAELAERAVLAERTRIARELHDVVAHHMSAIVVRAQAADRVAANQPEAPAEAVRWISDEGKQALTAMRSVVQVLRRGTETDGGTAALAPTPDGARAPDELRAVARRLRDAGRDVDLTLPRPWPTTSAESGLAVVRIVQEALTNVLLHSLAPEVTVAVTDDGADLRLRVHDPGPPLPSTAGRQGHGLTSMRERALAAGGALAAGPDGRGGWTVEARIPREPA
ncbi:sensor histidine kinase [Cellulosimicrobium cellulans]|uniref:sensor histidine kinase n=1 Tax=Cellulosimicrobium cellulans TaxID=1710 RepID=UPI002097D384|nr:histidine kinase [Cellulosimicrobium cellulans]MCO7274483.1 histidine kinase [Cellulosimicrobium cellulans]